MALTGISRDGMQEPKVKKVYYAGTDTLYTGYALAYDVSASLTDYTKTGFGRQVVKPATANLNCFAGVVAPSSNGFAGPGWVDVIVPDPGTIVTVYLNASADTTAFTSRLQLIDGSYGFTKGVDSTMNVQLTTLLALETYNSTATTKLAMFM